MAGRRFVALTLILILCSAWIPADAVSRPERALFDRAPMVNRPMNYYRDWFNDDMVGSPSMYENTLGYSVWRNEMIVSNVLTRREEGLDITGEIPYLTQLYGVPSADINANIEDRVENRITAAKELKARSIDFNYNVYHTDALVSIIVMSTTRSTAMKTEVFSINFNPNTGEMLSMATATGMPGIANLAEKLLTEMMRRNPERYNTAFNMSFLPSQPFYLTNDNRLVLLFDEFQLLNGADGIYELSVDLSRVLTVVIGRGEYRIQPGGYNLKMIPLRSILERLDYTTLWHEESPVIGIYRFGAHIVDIEPGINNYIVRDKKIRSLEAAPETMGGITYVPITFFDQILSMVTYTVDEWEQITFLSYIE